MENDIKKDEILDYLVKKGNNKWHSRDNLFSRMDIKYDRLMFNKLFNAILNCPVKYGSEKIIDIHMEGLEDSRQSIKANRNTHSFLISGGFVKN
jgi:hypothetical protein